MHLKTRHLQTALDIFNKNFAGLAIAGQVLSRLMFIFEFLNRMKRFYPAFLLALAVFASGCTRETGPDQARLKQLLTDELQHLKPKLVSKRTILFGKVSPMTEEHGFYRFSATVYIHDYMPGPANGDHFGLCCLGTMQNRSFEVHQSPDGKWMVLGDLICRGADYISKPNPAAGVEGIPLSSVAGTEGR